MKKLEFKIVHLTETDSTQDEIFRRAVAGAPEGTVVWADRQKSGRGRRGKVWKSPEGGLYFSILFRESQSQENTALPLTLGLAVADLAEEFGVETGLKWPNDVIVDDRKLAGVLCERKGDVSAAGVGINVEAAPLEGAVALSDAVRFSVKLPENGILLEHFLDHLSRRLASGSLVPEINARLYGRGEEALHDGKTVTIVEVAPSGALVVQTGDGIREIVSGEVVPESLTKILES